jgi:response regulator of citrate/malate metabolism
MLVGGHTCALACAYTDNQKGKSMIAHGSSSARHLFASYRVQVTSMTHSFDDQIPGLRLLENWLPLAQETNLVHGWRYTPHELEALIIRAAPSLSQARTALEARVILWHYHVWKQQHENDG